MPMRCIRRHARVGRRRPLRHGGRAHQAERCGGRAEAEISKAGTITVKMSLGNADEALLKKHKGRKLEAKIHLTFTSKTGTQLTTSVTVLLG